MRTRRLRAELQPPRRPAAVTAIVGAAVGAALAAGTLAACSSASGHPAPRALVPVDHRKAPATVPVTPAPLTTPTTDPTTSAAPTTATTVAAPPNSAPAPSQPPYPVTSSVLPLVDTSRPTVSHGSVVATSRTLTTLVWAPAVPGRWPLVVFGHGFQVGPEPYEAMLQAWSSAGYVVAAPEFPLGDQAVAGANLDENDLMNEPDDLRFVIDSLVAPGSPEAARIDPSRVAAAGHSDGAEAAVAAGVNPVPPGEPVIRAVIAMAVSPIPPGGPLATPPVLITQGDADSINPTVLGQQVYGQVRSPKYFLDLLGGGHLPPVEAGSAWLPTIDAVAEDFLNLYVAGGGSPTDLVRDGNHPGLTTLQTG